jgi:hypothetical protein
VTSKRLTTQVPRHSKSVTSSPPCIYMNCSITDSS